MEIIGKWSEISLIKTVLSCSAREEAILFNKVADLSVTLVGIMIVGKRQ